MTLFRSGAVEITLDTDVLSRINAALEGFIQP
jgi:hypothetical protein